ncbi:MAG TPA: hypothetical protein VF231_06335 [Candidatus Limnocylindrales bacterium]
MNARKLLEWGGLAAGIVLVAFGIGALYMGIDGRTVVRDSIKEEQIFFSEASDPAVAKHAEQWAGEQVTTGAQARAFAKVMREHTLESTGGLTYSQMGRYKSAENPGDPKGTSDAAAALKDENGAPVANSARDLWVTETGLTTALNMSYMAEQLSIFGIVVGVALLLTGIGLMILALAVLGGRFREQAAESARMAATPVAGH